MDIYTCGQTAMPHKAIEYLSKALEAEQHHIVEMARGVHGTTAVVMSACPLEKKQNPAWRRQFEKEHADAVCRPAKVALRSKFKPVPVD